MQLPAPSLEKRWPEILRQPLGQLRRSHCRRLRPQCFAATRRWASRTSKHSRAWHYHTSMIHQSWLPPKCSQNSVGLARNHSRCFQWKPGILCPDGVCRGTCQTLVESTGQLPLECICFWKNASAAVADGPLFARHRKWLNFSSRLLPAL